MPYNISYSDLSDPNKPDIIVNDNIIDERLSVAFVGKNASNYSSSISSNFLHLLENFASPAKNSNLDASSGPKNPVQGQVWYNSLNSDLGGLKVFNGTAWTPIGVVQKTPNDPNTLSSADVKIADGDLFVDTKNNQLYIKNGIDFRLVGPSTKQGEETTAKIETIVDTTNAPRSILALYVFNKKVAIVSDREFKTKAIIDGFETIKQGITLSTSQFQSSNINKFWGVSEKAESLIIGSTVVEANKFLRSDVANTTTEGFTISNNNGLNIGSSSSLSITIEPGTSSANNSLIYNKSASSKIFFRLTGPDNRPKTILTIEPGITTANSGVGINNTTPTESLDVFGNIKVTEGSIIITGTNDASVVNPSLSTLGGVFITKSLNVGQTLTVNGTSSLNGDVTINGVTNVKSNILPTISRIDIGSSSAKFDNMYANNYHGNLVGVADTAKGLVNDITIESNLDADVVFESISLGRAGFLKSSLNLNLNNKAIVSKNSIPTPSLLTNTDLMLISRSVINPITGAFGQQLFKLTGAELFNSFLRAATKIGSITLWPRTALIPNGYLPCDGREVVKSNYQALFDVIRGTAYTDGTGILKYKLPDLLSATPSGTTYIIFTGRFI
jgi:hypothetical protein